MNVTRRGFLGSILALGAAPAIVRIGNLMPVRSIVLPTTEEVMAVSGMVARGGGGNTLLTIDMITREALRILHSQIGFTHMANNTSDRSLLRAANSVLNVRKP